MEPKQQRTRERLERIFEVAELLFVERGYEHTSMRDIAKRVPCSMSAIYDRFRSKEGLLLAMHERYRVRTLESIEQSAPRAGDRIDLLKFVPRLVRFSMDVSRRHRGLRRAMIAQASFNPELAASERALRARLSALAHRMLLMGAAQMEHPAPETAADYVATMLSGMLLQRNEVVVEDQGAMLDDESFAEETARVCLRYMGVSAR